MSEKGHFKPADGVPGLLFVPAARGPKKHPCPECFECLWCPDTRCAACRRGCAARCRAPEEGAPGSDSKTGGPEGG